MLVLECALAVTLVGSVAAQPPTDTVLVVDNGRSVRLVVAEGPQTRRTAERVAAEIGPAVDAVVGFWGEDWPRDIPIDVTATPDQFAAALGDTGARATFRDVAAVATATWVDPAHGVADGQRIVFAAGAYDMTRPSLRLVLRHELFHFAARAHTALDAPLLLTEGVADFVARPTAPVPAAVATHLPGDADFAGPEPGRSHAYDAAWSFASFIADTYGDATLRQFYLSAAGAGHPELPVAARQVFDVELPELVAAWVHWQQAPV